MNLAVQPREGLPVSVRAGGRVRARRGGGVRGAAAGAGAGHPLHSWRAPAAPPPQAQGQDHLPTISIPYMYTVIISTATKRSSFFSGKIALY